MTKRFDMLSGILGHVAALAVCIGASWLGAYAIASLSVTGFSWPAVDGYFRDLSVLFSLGYIVVYCAFRSLPAHGRDVAANDTTMVGLATASVVVFVSAKWLGPMLDSSTPFLRATKPGDWYKNLTLIAALLLAIAAPRFMNARISRVTARTKGWVEKDTIALLVFAWVFLTVIWSLVIGDVSGSKLPVHRELSHGTIDITKAVFIFPVVLVVLGAAFLFLSRDRSMRSIGLVNEGTRNGYPMITWSQIVGTNETVAGKDAQGRFKIYLGVIVIASLAGLATGSAENMVFYGLIAAWLGALGLRGAGKFVMQGQTLGYAPHVKTEEDRREELTPMMRYEDCEAFVEESDGKLWFCIARGSAGDGPLPLVERVPFDSFGNFEEGSHKQWFRPRGAVTETLDWGVIVAQSSVGRVVLVAESLREQAWLIELLVKLQTTFIGPRDEMLRALKEAEHKRRADDEPEGNGGAPANDTPVKLF